MFLWCLDGGLHRLHIRKIGGIRQRTGCGFKEERANMAAVLIRELLVGELMWSTVDDGAPTSNLRCPQRIWCLWGPFYEARASPVFVLTKCASWLG